MVDLTEVLLTDGKVIKREADITLRKLSYRFGDFKIRSASPLSLTIENKGEKKLMISGQASLEVLIPCARCLEPVASRIDIQFENELDAEDKDYIDGYSLNTDQLVHDEALLVWPERVLCKEDCEGLCPVCGKNRNLGSCDCDTTVRDPRMAKILDIFNNAGK